MLEIYVCFIYEKLLKYTHYGLGNPYNVFLAYFYRVLENPNVGIFVSSHKLHSLKILIVKIMITD